MLVKAFVNRFLHWFTVGIITTILTLTFISKGVAVENVAFITTVASIVILTLEFPSGVLSDYLGRKKIYLFSLVFSISSIAILILANSFFAVVISFVVYGIGRAFSSGSIESFFIDEHIEQKGKDKMHQILTTMQSAEILGLCLGALAGGVIPIIWTKYFPEQNKFHGNLLVILILRISVFLITAFTVKEKHEKSESLSSQLKDFFSMVKEKKTLLLMMVIALIWGFTFNCIEIYWQPQLKSILGSDSKFWVFGLINGGYFGAALLGTILIKYFTKFNNFNLIILFKVIMGLFIVILSAQTGICGFTLIYLTMFMFNGAGNIIEQSIINKQTSPEHRSSLLSAISFSSQIGAIVGGLLSTIVIRMYSISIVWAICGFVFASSGVIYALMKKSYKEA